MTKIARFICLVTFVFMGVSCSKVNTIDIDISKLVNVNWHLIKMELVVNNPVSPAYNADTTMYPLDCDSDNYTKFLPDSLFIQYNGIIKCISGEPDSMVGKWSYNKTNFSLILDSGLQNEQLYKITELNFLNMVLVQDYSVEKHIENSVVTIRTRKTYYYQNE